jgi:hypothetical protein
MTGQGTISQAEALTITPAMRQEPKTEEYHPAENAVVEMTKRYSDGYRVSNFIVGMGTILKVIGIILGIFLAGTALMLPALRLGPVSALREHGGAVAIEVVVTGMVAGAIVWFALFVIGVFISAQGQMVRAALDAAVNSSPLFTVKQKVHILTAPVR